MDVNRVEKPTYHCGAHIPRDETCRVDMTAPGACFFIRVPVLQYIPPLVRTWSSERMGF